MPQQKKYTARTLGKACERYFASITRRVKVTELIDSGRRDDKGHAIMTPVPVVNSLGEELFTTEYLLPPSMAGLFEYLRIDKSTWSRYMQREDYAPIGAWVYERMKQWNEHELLTRSGKDLKGIIFNLQNNYGYSEKREVELGGRAAKTVTAASVPLGEREQLLRELMQEFRDDDGGTDA